MWARMTSYLKGGRSDGGPASPRGASTSAANSASTGAGPHTLLFHFILHPTNDVDEVRVLADSLSREFAFGLEAVYVRAAADIPDAVRRECALFAIPENPPGPEGDGSSGAENDDDIATRPEELLKYLHDDGRGTHRFATAHGHKQATSNVVIVAPRVATADSIPTARDFRAELAPLIRGGAGRAVVGRPGLLAVVGDSDASAGAPEHDYSDAEDTGDPNADLLRGTINVAQHDLRTSAGLKSVHERLRAKILALSATQRHDSTLISMDEPTVPANGSDGTEMRNDGPMATSCQSQWELRRLRGQQLSLLRTIAGNLENGDERAYKSLNAGTERFYESIGQYPACMRVLRNLGYTLARPGGVIDYDGDDFQAELRAADRARTVNLIESQLDALERAE